MNYRGVYCSMILPDELMQVSQGAAQWCFGVKPKGIRHM